MTREECLAIVNEQFDHLASLGKITNFYDYEKTFDAIWKGAGRAVLEKSISDLPKDSRKKKRSPNMETSK